MSYINLIIFQLPSNIQERLRVHLTRQELVKMEADFALDTKQREEEKLNKIIRVPMPTFPPTAMVYTVNNKNVETPQNYGSSQTQTIKSVPTSLIAQVLCPPESSRKPSRFYVCSGCNRELKLREMSTQTLQTAC